MTFVWKSKTLADRFISCKQRFRDIGNDGFPAKSEQLKMSILKALQKQRTENPAAVSRPAENIVPFERNRQRANQAPELLSSRSFRFDNSGSAFNGQPDSLVGTALPDLETDITAGANLNAGGLTRSGSKTLPDFVS